MNKIDQMLKLTQIALDEMAFAYKSGKKSWYDVEDAYMTYKRKHAALMKELEDIFETECSI